MPARLVDVLDYLYDWIPASVGPVVFVDDYKEESLSIYGGMPLSSHYALTVLANKGYWVGYNEKMQNPAWVAYRFYRAPDEPIEKRPSHFDTDERTHARVKSNDYTRSGYDRGHLAPNYGIARCYGREAQLETFLMSNVVPQRPDLNRNVWRNLELRVAKRYTKRFDEVWIITGPIYYRPTHVKRLNGHVAVPDAFFKIIFEERAEGVRAEAFIIPQDVNSEERLQSYLVSIDTIETLTQLNICPQLSDKVQAELEANPAKRVW
jgi:endonuclease G